MHICMYVYVYLALSKTLSCLFVFKPSREPIPAFLLNKFQAFDEKEGFCGKRIDILGSTNSIPRLDLRSGIQLR